ncbi:hypothetical protein AMAG_15926 [Allomyces macrogynus ATCC 38327]|uniref:Maltose/galactoside acetyltransferase domain-containing protein n=1 Tax=Allomyces macrogynus (strain ATCC 38327) TaxID=578462 RepID=A0A0L0TBR6_ALLM3|nr:hypothetical protein AMAG_15926 [Allomyces macrogynus ATCC 38327]|eukprot:KNE71984.1 hypothetical protein AMAG_15926 [Allomyces macrogynus ATCC 38327]
MADEYPQLDHRARMLRGQTYRGVDPDLVAERAQTRTLLHKYNTTDPADRATQIAILRELFRGGVAHLADDEMPEIIPPFACDYGSNITFGKHCFFNFGATILDVCPIHIGERVLFGPSVSLYAAEHPISPTARNGPNGPEYGKPISIGNDVWIGGGAILVSGVEVGSGSTVGAGSVVTRNVPSMTVAVGNPARVVKKIVEDENYTPDMAWEEGADPKLVGIARLDRPE